MSRRDDGGVTLNEVVHAELSAAGVTPSGERITVDGPPVTFPHQTMQLLALAIHELATNALKHVALKVARGRLSVSWQILDPTGVSQLQFAWVESGVEFDEKKANSFHGFGRELLEHALPYQLDATTRLELGKNGMRFWLVMPWRERKEP